MFSALRQGSPLYVMDKQNLTLRTAIVQSVPQATSFTQMPWLMQPFNATVKFEDGSTAEFQQMQPQQSVAQYGNTVVTETKELMAQEVEEMTRQSKAVLESIGYHEKVIASCEDMLKRLSPAFAKEKETDSRLNTLETGMKSLNDGIANLTSMLKNISGFSKN